MLGGFNPHSWIESQLEEQLYPVESPLPKDRPPPEVPIVLEEAEIRWGKTSNFDYGARKGPHLKYTVRISSSGGGGDEEEEEPEIPVLTLTEVDDPPRKVETIKVTSEDDPDVWVEVDRIEEISFGGSLSDLPEGYRGKFQVKYVLKHPPAPGT